MPFAEVDATTLLMTAVATLAGVLATLGAAAWKAVTWIRTEVVVPTVGEHRKLVAALQEAVPAHTKMLGEIKDLQSKQTASLLDIEENMKGTYQASFEHLSLQKEEMVYLGAIQKSGESQERLLKAQAEELVKFRSVHPGQV